MIITNGASCYRVGRDRLQQLVQHRNCGRGRNDLVELHSRVSYINSNKITVGVGTTRRRPQLLAVQNGAVLVNNGDLAIGNDASSTFNAVLLGGPGRPR